ncbi:MAG: Ldh family oxidoreductase [Flavobacteriales bacterium]|nr:Ldh family oxidoreductase [Flavobacteriales bacterium]
MFSSSEYSILTESDLREFTRSVFLKIGCSADHATLASDVLLAADLRGIDSHGVARLSGYVRLWQKGRINTVPNIKIIRQKQSTATIDADGALGLVSAPFAMQLAIERSGKFGSGMIAVGNSNHFGIAGYHAMMALEFDMIGFAMTNASPLVAPTRSKERMLGTNPMAYAIPAGKYDPVVIDLATSTAANGKLEIAQRKKKTVPQGWIQTKDGEQTIDPNALKEGGALLPLGSFEDQGSHKGFALSALVDIFSGVLSGANFGPWVPPFVSFLDVLPNLPGKGLGHFVGAMEVDGFIETNEFKRKMDQWIERFKNSQLVSESKPVIIPGEPETMQKAERALNGIPLIDSVVADLTSMAEMLKLDHPFI